MSESPGKDCDLFSKVVEVELCVDGVAAGSVESYDGVAYDGVSCSSYVEGSVGIGTGVFDDDFFVVWLLCCVGVLLCGDVL